MVGMRRVPVDARLGLSVDNRGCTRTHMPDWGSLAIDGGDPSSFVTRNLRAMLRPCGIAPDMGAVEVRCVFMGKVTQQVAGRIAIPQSPAVNRS